MRLSAVNTRAPSRRQRRASLNSGEQRACVEQPERLAREVRVRREIERQVSRDVMGMQPHARENSSEPLGRQRSGFANQHERPRPRHQPVRHLETARPVDPDAVRVRLDPRLDRAKHAFGVALVAAHRIRLCQAGDPLVPIQLPHDFAVAHFRGVERVQLRPVDARRAARPHRIEVPVDRIPEPQRLIAKKVEAMLQRRRRSAHHRVAVLRQPPERQTEDSRLLRRTSTAPPRRRISSAAAGLTNAGA